MDDIAEAVGGQALVNLHDVSDRDRKFPTKRGDFVLNMEIASHGLGVFPDGTRFDVRVRLIDVRLGDGTKVVIGLHLDMRVDGDAMITKLHNHFEKITITGQVLPTNVRTARNRVADVRKTTRATEYIPHIHTPVHRFG